MTATTTNVHTFYTRSGGSFPVPAELQPFVTDSTLEFRYGTTRNGDAYAASVTVQCKEIRDGVYETESGVQFVYDYTPGGAWYFDQGEIRLV